MRWAATILGLSIGWAAAASEAKAAPPDLDQKRVRVHVDTNLIGWTRAWNWSDDPDVPDSHTDVVGFGLGRPTQRGSATYLAGTQLVGLGAAGIINRWVAVGARTGISFDNVNYDTTSDGTRLLGGQLVPYVHVMLLNEAVVVPFVEARAGFGGARQRYLDVDVPDGGEALVVRGLIYPTIGGGGGVHFFVAELISIDLALGVDHRWVFQKIETTGVDGDYDKAARELELGVEAGLSLWF